MTSPDPGVVLACSFAYERKGLGIMDDRDRRFEVEPFPVVLVVREEDFERFRRQPVGLSVQRVVKRLGDLEEIGAAFEDLPAMLMSSSRASGTRRLRIPATPPPTAVELTISTSRSTSVRASDRSSSISGAPSNVT